MLFVSLKVCPNTSSPPTSARSFSTHLSAEQNSEMRIVTLTDMVPKGSESSCFSRVLHPSKPCPIHNFWLKFGVSFAQTLFPGSRVRYLAADSLGGHRNSSAMTLIESRVADFTVPLYTLKLKRVKRSRSFFGPWYSARNGLLYRKDVVPARPTMRATDLFPPLIVVLFSALLACRWLVRRLRLPVVGKGTRSQSLTAVYLGIWYLVTRNMLRANIIRFYNRAEFQVTATTLEWLLTPEPRARDATMPCSHK